MATATDRLAHLLEPTLRGLGYELLGIEQQRAAGGRRVLRVYLDREGGITLEDCEKASYQVSGVLDAEQAVSGAYTLEVSSPGLDRPLFTLQQHRRFIGAEVRVRLRSQVRGRRTLTGTLIGVRDETISVEVDGEAYEIPFQSIERSRLVPVWPDRHERGGIRGKPRVQEP